MEAKFDQDWMMVEIFIGKKKLHNSRKQRFGLVLAKQGIRNAPTATITETVNSKRVSNGTIFFLWRRCHCKVFPRERKCKFGWKNSMCALRADYGRLVLLSMQVNFVICQTVRIKKKQKKKKRVSMCNFPLPKISITIIMRPFYSMAHVSLIDFLGKRNPSSQKMYLKCTYIDI